MTLDDVAKEEVNNSVYFCFVVVCLISLLSEDSTIQLRGQVTLQRNGMTLKNRESLWHIDLLQVDLS